MITHTLCLTLFWCGDDVFQKYSY